ncbi:hypothetical protein DPMN_151390 [Dreissena polymorpha]|uniref:Uncharacterized protein n=1 Tax=Dreissena polymorpha TaxID=45954 RepID=A0A9D4FIC1_DREPO|nr:hypothetical protein DPMN_151390 [Dreissena polymorpha]
MAAKGEDRPKRTNSEVSNDSANEGSIKQQLESMEKSLAFITNQMKSILKREEIETLITNTITSIITEVERRNEEHIKQLKNELAKELKLQLQQCVNKQVEEKTKDLTEHMKNLEFENESLKETITSLRTECKQTIDNMSSQVNENSQRCSEAIKRSNYNEQYSRKNNVKILDVQEDHQETIPQLTTKVLNILQDKGIQIQTEQLLAIHRIPNKKGNIRPVILKLKSNNDKTLIMRKRKELKAAGHRLVDDVTALNSALMNRLSLHPSIETTWFFNGSVFALTKNQERIKFDIYDDINNVISDHRTNRRK